METETIPIFLKSTAYSSKYYSVTLMFCIKRPKTQNGEMEINILGQTALLLARKHY